MFTRIEGGDEPCGAHRNDTDIHSCLLFSVTSQCQAEPHFERGRESVEPLSPTSNVQRRRQKTSPRSIIITTVAMARSVSYQTVGVVAISSILAGFTLATWGASAYRRRKADDEEPVATGIAAASATSAATGSTTHVGQAHPAASLPEHQACVYLDYNATTPVFPEVTAAIYPFISTSFGNPSSPHVYAAACRQAVETARDQVGRLINAPVPQKTVYFTSCGSESDNRAVDIALHHYHKDRSATPRVVTCAVEHPAVLLYLRHLQDRGAIHLVVLGVDAEGLVSVGPRPPGLTRWPLTSRHTV